MYKDIYIYIYIYYVTFKITCGLLTQGLAIPRCSSSHLPRSPSPGRVLCNVRCRWKLFFSDLDVGMKELRIEWKCTNVSLLLRLHSKQMAMFPNFHNSICHSCAVNVSLWANPATPPPPTFFFFGRWTRTVVHQQRIWVPHNNTMIGLASSMTFGNLEGKKKEGGGGHLRPCQCLAKVKIITH